LFYNGDLYLMKLSFERLQQIILEETIKLLQENEVSARAVDKITGVSQQRTAGARAANLEKAMKGRAVQSAKARAANIARTASLNATERRLAWRLVYQYPSLRTKDVVKLVRPAAAAITGPAAASAATTALAAGGKSALRTALANAIRGAFTAGLAGGPVGLLAGLVTQTAAVLAYEYLQKGARENKERIRDTIVRVIHKNARNVTSMERRRLKAFIRGMGDAKEATTT
jgi:hypothetical protein